VAFPRCRPSTGASLVTDAQRRHLYEGLTQAVGDERADTMMELLPPVSWSDVARRGDIAELRGEVAQLRGEMKGQFAKLIMAELAMMIALIGLTISAAKPL
jgi:hypothetical protein